MPSVHSQHKGGGLRPPPQRGKAFGRPPVVVSFVLAVNTGPISVLRRNTCVLLRAKTSTLLRRKTCAVLRARTCACSEPIQRKLQRGGRAAEGRLPSVVAAEGRHLCIGSEQSTCPSSQHSTCLASPQGRCLGSLQGTRLMSQH